MNWYAIKTIYLLELARTWRTLMPKHCHSSNCYVTVFCSLWFCYWQQVWWPFKVLVMARL